MIGAIIGDIVGSRFEFNNHRSVDFELFHPDCSLTDDTICTVAVADWLLQESKYRTPDRLTKIMRSWCQKYPNPSGGYGRNFNRWIHDDTMGAYFSFGNGSAMRVSPVAWAFTSIHEVLKAAEYSAIISHNHPEGIKGAKAIAVAIFMLRKGDEKASVLKYIRSHYDYLETASCKVLKKQNMFDETCQGTIPACLQCLEESTGFESAIRLAVSIGGDTDTIAAIVGSMAEAAYGIPDEIYRKSLEYLPVEMIDVINRFNKTVGNETEELL